MESFFQVRQARNHVTSLEDRTREIESQIENIRNKISEIRKNIRNRELQIEENESNLVQTGNERFIKIIEKENYLLDQARIIFNSSGSARKFPKFYPGKENSKLEEFKIKLKEAELNLELSRIEWSQGKSPSHWSISTVSDWLSLSERIRR